MNPSGPTEAEKIFSTVKKAPGSADVEVVLTPPAIYIPLFKERGLSLGVQNIYFKEDGAFTGEISAKMAKNSGCKYTLVGHSERRSLFNEGDEEIEKKVRSALDNEITPIICIGETSAQKNKELTGKVIKRQLRAALKAVKKEDIGNVVIAYEPIWAIGSKNPCNPEVAFKMRLLIKKRVAQKLSRDFAENTPVVYGGSVNLGNCQDYTRKAKFNGLLVGGASLKPNKFGRMIKEI